TRVAIPCSSEASAAASRSIAVARSPRRSASRACLPEPAAKSSTVAPAGSTPSQRRTQGDGGRVSAACVFAGKVDIFLGSIRSIRYIMDPIGRATIETAAALLRSRLAPRDLALCGAALTAAVLLPLVAHLAPALLDWRIALGLSALLAIAGLGWACVVVRRELIAGQRSAELL